MNRKFKHKISGNIAIETSSEKNYKVEIPQNFTIPKWIVENSCDWEEIKSITYHKLIKQYDDNSWIENNGDAMKIGRVVYSDEIVNNMPMSYWIKGQEEYWKDSMKEEYEAQFREYEILSFKVASNAYAGQVINKEGKFTGYYGIPNVPLEKAIEREDWTIHSVRRLSDGEIFTVGDKMIHPFEEFYHDTKIGTLNRIFICKNPSSEVVACLNSEYIIGKLFLSIDNKSGNCLLENAKKVSVPLFYTEDNNVPIYEGGEYWIVCPISNNHIQKEPPAQKDWKQKDWGYKYFSTKKAAEDYISKNKVLFVTEDEENLYFGDEYYYIILNYIIIDSWQVLKHKLDWTNTKKCLLGGVQFKNREKAQEYIINLEILKNLKK